jgi:predicted ester cyclase
MRTTTASTDTSLTAAATGGTIHTVPHRTSPLENVALVLDHYEDTTNEKTLARLDQHLASDFVEHSAPAGVAIRGPEGVRKWMMLTHAAFPDVRVMLDGVIAVDDTVVVRGTWRGTHQGTWMGVAPTGRSVSFGGIVIWRIVGGRIAER